MYSFLIVGILMLKIYRCLAWCALAARHPAPKHATRTTYYKQFEHEIRDEGITWPISLNQIDKFEALNNLRINVITWDKSDGFYPLKVRKLYISLLLLLYLKIYIGID